MAPSHALAFCEGAAKRWQGYVRAGLLSREIGVWGADTLLKVEGHATGGDSASRRRALRGRRTWARTESSCARTGRSRGCSRAVVDAPSGMVRGVAYRWPGVRGG